MSRSLQIALITAFVCLSAVCAHGQQFVWARQATANGPVHEPVIDGNGNCYIAGSFTDTAYFDGQRVVGTSMVSGRLNFYLTKFDPAGM